MADIELVINIDNVDYEYIKNNCIVPIKYDNHIYDAIRNGKSLDEVIGNIKDELYENQWYIDDLDLVIEIIDKHISGKEQE